MKVCICGGTNPATNPKYLGFGDELGQMLCDNDIRMIWGGNAYGVLSQIHEKYQQNRKGNTLILPRRYEKDLASMKAERVIMTDSLFDRMAKMFHLTNVVLFLPGGIGTMFEFWSALECKRAREYDIDIVVFNYNNFFKNQFAHFDFINANGFTRIGAGGAPYIMEPTSLFSVANTTQEVIYQLLEIKRRRESAKHR